MKNRKLSILAIGFVTIILALAYMPNVHAYYREDWEDDVTEKTFVPVFIAYDPNGSESYQQVYQALTASLTLHFKNGGGVTVDSIVDTTANVYVSTDYKTSNSSDSKYVGPGGDAIIGKKLTLYWHLWGYTMITIPGTYSRITKAELTGMSDDGMTLMFRADLSASEYTVYSVSNLRGTVGAWHYPQSGTIDVGSGQTWVHYMNHTWPRSSNIDTDCEISVHNSLATAHFGTYWTASGSGNLTYTTYLYSHSSYGTKFTINADAGQWAEATAYIYDYIYWFKDY